MFYLIYLAALADGRIVVTRHDEEASFGKQGSIIAMTKPWKCIHLETQRLYMKLKDSMFRWSEEIAWMIMAHI